jgi:hypothetical protein
MTSSTHQPMMVASENGRLGLLAAMQLLRAGGRALDAVELQRDAQSARRR